MAVTKKENVLLSSTSGDTYTPPARIRRIAVVNTDGVNAATIQISIGGTVVFDTASLAAGARLSERVDIMSKETITITRSSGTGTFQAYLYTE